jgi:putative flippase GtrA
MIKNNKIIRFGIVGAINTALDFGLLLLFTHLGLPKIVSNTLSTGLAFIFSFFANKKYTFRSSSGNVKREIALFTIVTLFGLWVLQNGVIWLISPLCAALLHNKSLALLTAKLAGTIVSLTWNYLTYDILVFRKDIT